MSRSCREIPQDVNDDAYIGAGVQGVVYKCGTYVCKSMDFNENALKERDIMIALSQDNSVNEYIPKLKAYTIENTCIILQYDFLHQYADLPRIAYNRNLSNDDKITLRKKLFTVANIVLPALQKLGYINNDPQFMVKKINDGWDVKMIDFGLCTNELCKTRSQTREKQNEIVNTYINDMLKMQDGGSGKIWYKNKWYKLRHDGRKYYIYSRKQNKRIKVTFLSR